MGQIMARTNQQQQQLGGNRLGGGKLSPYFERLPLDKQFIALQNGYNSMSKEFSNLARVAPDSLITIKKPLSIQEQFNNQFPLLSVNDQKGGEGEGEDEGEGKGVTDKSEHNNLIENNGSIKVKKI